jgi:hypothetical protein
VRRCEEIRGDSRRCECGSFGGWLQGGGRSGEFTGRVEGCGVPVDLVGPMGCEGGGVPWGVREVGFHGV